MIAVIKFLFMIVLITLFLVHHLLVRTFIWNDNKRVGYYQKSIMSYANLAGKILNIEVATNNLERIKTPSLIVVNHLSYVDVIVLATRYPTLFITSVEIKETFLLGLVTQLAGCCFVERRKALVTNESKEKELNLMRNKLSEGFSILLFPEGTSSDGKGVLPFKATFFQLALDCKIPVLPLTIKYSGESHAIVPWYGSMGFPGHLMRVCALDKVELELHELNPVYGNDKFEIAKTSHALISECYG